MFELVFFPLLAYFLISFGMVALVLRSAPHATSRLVWLYVFVAASGAILAVAESGAISGADIPYLGGSDGEGYFQQAVAINQLGFQDSLGSVRSNYLGYQFVLAWVFMITSVSLSAGLLLNALVVVFTALLLVKISELLSKGDRRSAYWTLLLCFLYFPFIFFSSILLKDPFINLGMVLVAYGVVDYQVRGRIGMITALTLFLSLLIFATMRIPLLVVPFVVYLVAVKSLNLARTAMLGTAGLAIYLTWGLIAGLSAHEFDVFWIQDQLISKEKLDYVFESGVSSSGFVGRLVGGYDNWSLIQRVLGIPITVAIQYLMPVNFWDFSAANSYPPAFFGVNLNVVWLGFVGPVVIFTAINIRVIAVSAISAKLFWIGMSLYVIVALTHAGLLPRYAAGSLYFMFPACGEVLAACGRSFDLRLRLQTFFRNYYFVALAAGAFYVLFV